MKDLTGHKVAILATHGFEQSELEVPLGELTKAGAHVQVVSPASEAITGWDKDDWGRPVRVDRDLDDATADDFDALVLPGGQINPDLLRVDADAISFVESFWSQGKTIGAICHAPWLLVEAGIVKGRKVTSYKSIATDVKNAGGLWEDSEVVTDQGLVSSRNPDDLPAFCSKLAEEISEGRHDRKSAA